MGRRSTPVLALALLLLGLSSCQTKTAAVQAVAARPSNNTPELAIDNMNAQSYDGTGLKWEVHGQSSLVYTAKNLMKIIAFDATMFSNGQKSTHITADQCLKNTATASTPESPGRSDIAPGLSLDVGDMYLKGNVVVISTDGNKLTTDWLHYHKKTELITSTAPVRVDRDDSVTTGIGLKADSTLAHMEIYQQTVVLKDTDAKPHK